MEPQFATVTSKGQIVIPANLRRKHGIRKGTRIAIREDNLSLILQPITDGYIESLRGSLQGGPSLTAFLKKERRREFRIEERKIKEFRTRR
ncbi:MAG: AbrB/MazE/SpoVT family DNA-binding domain-containing protein [Terriglobia bacterium]